MQVKKQQLEPYMEQQTGSKLGKEYVKAVHCHPAYLTYMQSTSCEMLGWTKHKLKSRLLREMSTTSDMQMTPPLRQKVNSNYSLLMRVKEESEKAGLKLNTQKTKIMASSPITSWQTEGEKVEAVTDFIFLGSKISDYSHEMKRSLLLGRISMTNLNSVLKTREYHVVNISLYSQSYYFPISHIWM